MKKNLVFVCLLFLSTILFSQGTWVQKASLPGNGRCSAFVFTIGSCAYIGGGQINSSGTYVSDFWEYNATTDTWTQKASFPGGIRDAATAFTIDSLGYVCFGFNGACQNDVWSYNPTTNAWTQKSYFPGAARYGAFAFTIGSNAYIGKGSAGGPPFLTDFWEYNSTTDSWTQKTSFTSSINAAPIGFSINNKGYAGLGTDGNGSFTNEFFEYDPTTDSWTQKAAFPIASTNALYFVISNYAFVGTGNTGLTSLGNNLWSYDPLLNTWTAIASVGYGGRAAGSGFAIGNKGYLGFGYNSSNTFLNDLWEYTPACPSVPATPLGTSTLCQNSTNINYTTSDSANVTEYIWSISPSNAGTISGTTTTSTVSLNNTFYGTAYIKVIADNGTCISNYSDSIPVTVLQSPTATITSNGVTTFCQGSSVTLNANTGANLFYQWQKNGITIGGATDSLYNANQTGSYTVVVTNINNCSTTSSAINITVVPYPAATITPSDSTTICQGYSVTLNANTGTGLSYHWQLNGTNITGAIGSSCLAAQPGNYTVVVTNSNNCSTTSSPVNIKVSPSPITSIITHGNTSFCQGDSVLLTANYVAGLTYQWQKNSSVITGATDTLLEVSQSGNYSVVVTNSYNCTATDNVTITVTPYPVANAGNDKNICYGDTVTLNATGGTTYLWDNGVTQGVPFIPQTTSTYVVTVTTNGCSSQDSLKITVNPLPPVPTVTINGNALLSSSTTGNQWFLNGNPINGATSQIYTATVSGFYQLQVTNSYGCSSMSTIINFGLGIEENSLNNDINIYPNPAKDELTIETNLNTEQKFEIINLIGQTIYTSYINKKATVNTSDFPGGVYILKLYTDKETVIKKFIKE